MLPKLLLFLLILELLLWQSQCSKSSNPYTIRQEATSFLSDTLKASTTLLPFLYSSQIGRVSAAGISSGQQSDSNVRYFDSIEETAQFILANCGTIVDAVNATGHLLYRGDDRNLTLQTPNVQRLSPDLLSFDTYKSPVALDYFNSIDGAMASRGMLVRPSIGHIATSDIVAAGQWGVPVSVWPIDPFSYLSYKYDTNLWEEEWATPQGKRGPFFWKSEERLNKFIDTELLYNKGLEAALTKNGEVMIARSCIPCKEANSWACKSTLGFCPSIVAVPLFLEPKLLKLLNITPYSSKAKVTKAKGMELEGIPMKTRKFRSYGPLYD